MTLLHLRIPVADSVETASLLRSKLPHVKVVGFSSVTRDMRAKIADELHKIGREREAAEIDNNPLRS